jgi:dihydroorotase
MKTLALSLLLIPAICSAQETYDLLLKGGHVIDPKNHVNAVRDVAIAQGRIAAVAAEIPVSKAYKTVNGAGLYVGRYPNGGRE